MSNLINVTAWGWPQYVYIALSLFGMGVIMAKQGKPREHPYGSFSDWSGIALAWALLIFGGFLA